MGQKILVVGYDESTPKVVKRFLKMQGYDARIAENNQAALDILNDEKFNVIIIDDVKEALGEELIAELAKRLDLNIQQIIYMSSYPRSDNLPKQVIFFSKMKLGLEEIVNFVKKKEDQ